MWPAGEDPSAAWLTPNSPQPGRKPGEEFFQEKKKQIVIATCELPVTLRDDGFDDVVGDPVTHTDAPTLDELLRRVGHGDRNAFEAFYDATKSRVFGMVRKVLRDPGYSEETTHDVYLQVWRSAESYDPGSGSALAWLLTLAHRRAVDRVRAEQSATQRDFRYGVASLERDADRVSDAVISGDERRRVAGCLAGLTDLQRQCIELAYYEGLTYVQVSERLSANLATVKSRMRDGLRGLRNCLDMR